MEHKTRTKAMSWLLSLVLVLGLLPAFSSPARADEPETTYTITIPSTLTVSGSGWNATGGISATGTLASGKKLTVTATSANSWALKSGDNSVGYKLATASTDTTATTSWEFTELSSTATNKAMGIIVENYDTKPAGTYTDTVTFTAKVEDAVTITYSSIGTPFQTPPSMPANFTEVTLEEAQAYGQSLTGPWLIIYARSGSNYKFITSKGVNSTNTWDDIINGESFGPGAETSIIVPVKN